MHFLIYFIVFSMISLSAYEKQQYIDFEPFFNHSFVDAIHEAGALPIDINYSKLQFQETFAEFVQGEELNEITSALENWAPAFFSSESALPWQNSNYRFGIFGSKQSTNKKTRLIQGINCKICLEYCD